MISGTSDIVNSLKQPESTQISPKTNNETTVLTVDAVYLQFSQCFYEARKPEDRNYELIVQWGKDDINAIFTVQGNPLIQDIPFAEMDSITPSIRELATDAWRSYSYPIGAPPTSNRKLKTYSRHFRKSLHASSDQAFETTILSELESIKIHSRLKQFIKTYCHQNSEKKFNTAYKASSIIKIFLLRALNISSDTDSVFNFKFNPDDENSFFLQDIAVVHNIETTKSKEKYIGPQKEPGLAEIIINTIYKIQVSDEIIKLELVNCDFYFTKHMHEKIGLRFLQSFFYQSKDNSIETQRQIFKRSFVLNISQYLDPTKMNFAKIKAEETTLSPILYRLVLLLTNPLMQDMFFRNKFPENHSDAPESSKLEEQDFYIRKNIGPEKVKINFNEDPDYIDLEIDFADVEQSIIRNIFYFLINKHYYHAVAIKNCPELTTDDLLGLLEHNKNCLESLSVINCDGLTEEELEIIVSSGIASLKKLKVASSKYQKLNFASQSLASLDISECSSLTQVSLQTPALQSFAAQYCSSLQRIDFKSVMQLTNLQMAGCENISAVDLISYLVQHAHLASLSLPSKISWDPNALPLRSYFRADQISNTTVVEFLMLLGENAQTKSSIILSNTKGALRLDLVYFVIKNKKLFSNIENITLANSSLDDRDWKYLYHLLSECKKIKKLNLSGCKIPEAQMSKIKDALNLNQSGCLELDVTNVSFNFNAIKYLFEINLFNFTLEIDKIELGYNENLLEYVKEKNAVVTLISHTRSGAQLSNKCIKRCQDIETVTKISRENATALLIAITKKTAATVSGLIKEVNLKAVVNLAGDSFLHTAITTGSYESIQIVYQEMIKQSINTSYLRNHAGLTPLKLAENMRSPALALLQEYYSLEDLHKSIKEDNNFELKRYLADARQHELFLQCDINKNNSLHIAVKSLAFDAFIKIFGILSEDEQKNLLSQKNHENNTVVDLLTTPLEKDNSNIPLHMLPKFNSSVSFLNIMKYALSEDEYYKLLKYKNPRNNEDLIAIIDAEFSQVDGQDGTSSSSQQLSFSDFVLPQWTESLGSANQNWPEKPGKQEETKSKEAKIENLNSSGSMKFFDKPATSTEKTKQLGRLKIYILTELGQYQKKQHQSVRNFSTLLQGGTG